MKKIKYERIKHYVLLFAVWIITTQISQLLIQNVSISLVTVKEGLIDAIVMIAVYIVFDCFERHD